MYYSKEEHFDTMEHWIFSFNPYWEAPLGYTRLRNETEEACDELILYCTLIKNKLKKYKGDKDYTKYPEEVQKLIKNVLDIVTDGRELHKEVEYEGRKYNHHCEANGYLSFENNPLGDCDSIISKCNEIKQLLQSEENTKDLNKFIGKTLEFNHYESGSAVIHIEKINEVDGKFSFDGDMIIYETVNGNTGGDGVLLYSDVTECAFSEIPCAFFEDPETSAELAEMLEGGEETTMEKAKENAMDTLRLLFEQDFDI